MQRACEHDGFSKHQQGFEAKEHSVRLNASFLSLFFKSLRLDSQWKMRLGFQAIEGNLFCFKSFT